MDNPPLSEVVQTLADEVVAQVLRQYRIPPQEAKRLVSEVLARDGPLRQAAEQAASADRLRRTSAFKKAAAAAKKHVYYSLRRYRPATTDQDAALEALRALPRDAPADQRAALARAVAEGHRSTAERLPYVDAFYAWLFEQVGRPRRVLDVGCGVQPLLFPFDARGDCVERYVAIDKDADAIAAVETLALARGDGRLTAIRDGLDGGWETALAPVGVSYFDVALLLKVVPVVQRQQAELLEVLAQTPATQWLVTGSRLALAKQQDIERRERAVLRRFIEQAGRHEVAEFVLGEEVGWLVE